jgi:hypothetical protein
MAPFLSAADEVVVQSQTKSFLFELERPPRLREIRIFGHFPGRASTLPVRSVSKAVKRLNREVTDGKEGRQRHPILTIAFF